MRFEEREVPRNYNIGIREMLDEEDPDDDIVEINWEDIEQISEDCSLPGSEDEKDEYDVDDDEDMELTDDAVDVLSGHTRSVFCCAFHPNDLYAITGGEDDRAILWKLSTNKPVSILSHYQDSVCEVGFSFDGLFVAIADMMGNVEVYKTDSDLVLIKVWSERIEEVQWMEWHKQAHVLLVGGLGTHVYMWKIPSGECKVLTGECSSPVGTFMPDGKRAIVTYRNGALKIFNLVSGDTVCSFRPRDWIIEEIISLAVHPNNNLGVVGDISGNIALFTTQPPCKVVKEFTFKERDESSVCCIENLLFTKDRDVLYLLVSTSKGIYIWDYIKQAVKKYIVVIPGVTKMSIIGETDLIAVGTTSGAIAIIDIKQGIIVRSFTGHADTILSLAVSKDGNNLMTTSDDTTIRLFSVSERMETT